MRFPLWQDPRRSMTASASTQPETDQPRRLTLEFLPLLSLCIFAMAITRLAWVSDDAFISMRAVENLLSGHGLVSNPPERVQAFTSPLFTLLLIPARWLTGDAY